MNQDAAIMTSSDRLRPPVSVGAGASNRPLSVGVFI